MNPCSEGSKEALVLPSFCLFYGRRTELPCSLAVRVLPAGMDVISTQINTEIARRISAHQGEHVNFCGLFASDKNEMFDVTHASLFFAFCMRIVFSLLNDAPDDSPETNTARPWKATS